MRCVRHASNSGDARGDRDGTTSTEAEKHQVMRHPVTRSITRCTGRGYEDRAMVGAVHDLEGKGSGDVLEKNSPASPTKAFLNAPEGLNPDM